MDEALAPWPGRLFLGPGLVLYLGPGGRADEHAHHAVQLVIGESDGVSISGRAQVRAALVPAGAPHAMDACGTRIALLLVERHGAAGAALDREARRADPGRLGHVLAGVELPSPAVSAPIALAWAASVLAAILPEHAATKPSRAVARALAYLEATLQGVPSLAVAAERAGLSPSRLTHRFRAEVGIPFRRYVLWARLRRVVEATRRGRNLSEAAAEAGFADSAHLSRTFRAMFGLPPSRVLPALEIAGP